MTDKVQKIREWVKARLDENASKQSLPQFYGMMEEDARFLDFLDSLQEEPANSVWHNPKEMPPDDIIVFRYIDGLTTCRYVGQTMKGVLAWAYFKDIKNL